MDLFRLSAPQDGKDLSQHEALTNLPNGPPPRATRPSGQITEGGRSIGAMARKEASHDDQARDPPAHIDAGFRNR